MNNKSIIKNEIRMAGFTAKGRQNLIDRREVIGENGRVDYSVLMEKVGKLGSRLSRESRILQTIQP